MNPFPQHLLTDMQTQTKPPQTAGAQALASLMRARDTVLRWAFISSTLVGLALVLRERSWTSEVRFSMQNESASGSLLALAAQYGLSGGGNASGEGAVFYADYVSTHDVLARLLLTQFVNPETGVTQPLIDILDVDSFPSPRREALGMIELRERVRGRASPRTGVVTVTASFNDPTLSQQVTRFLLGEIGTYSADTRRSQAAAQRDFAMTRLEELKAELSAAEDARTAFVLRNRSYDSDPVLRLQWQRLSREVDAKSQLVATMSQAFEQARIDAVRDTPTLTVVTQPTLPGLPDRRGLLLRAILAAVVVGSIRLVWLRLRNPTAFEGADLEAELAALKKDLASPLAFCRRLVGFSRSTEMQN